MSKFNIGRLGGQTGVNIETIRYYEKIGLLPAPGRTPSGYRQYDDSHVQRLNFIRRGRELGFSIDAIRALLALAQTPDSPCDGADRMVADHLDGIDRKIADLMRLRQELAHLQQCCGPVVAQCRIIESLASGGGGRPAADQA